MRATSTAARTALPPASSFSSSPLDPDAEPIDEQVQDEIIRGFERDAAAARRWARWLALALCAAVAALALVCMLCGMDARTELEFHTLLRAGLGTEGLLALQLSSLASILIVGQCVLYLIIALASCLRVVFNRTCHSSQRIVISTLLTFHAASHALTNTVNSAMRSVLSSIATAFAWLVAHLCFAANGTAQLHGALLLPPIAVSILLVAVLSLVEREGAGADAKIAQLRAAKYRFKSL